MSRQVSRRRFLSGSLALAGGGALWLWHPSSADAQVFNVQDFGAVGDGQQDDTSAIRQALAALPGVLVFPAGDYRITGDLRPPTGAELQFDAGARIVQYGNAHILYLDGVNNVKVTGATLHHTGVVHPGGPSNIRISGSHDLEFHDIVNERTDGWGFYIHGNSQDGDSHDILVDGYINTNRNYTTANVDDGMDIIGYNVTVRNFDIATNDDAISIKSYGGQGTRNVLLENGIIRSRDGGLTFGSEISGDGIHDVTVRNVSFDSVGVPIYFKGYNSNSTGEVYNVLLENISATGGAQRFLFFHTVTERTDKFHDITVQDANFAGGVEFECMLIQRQRDITLRRISWPANGSSKEGVYLLDTHSSHFEDLSFDGHGSQPVKLSGSATLGNSFAGMPEAWLYAVNGASIDAQIFSPGGFSPVAQVSSMRWP